MSEKEKVSLIDFMKAKFEAMESELSASNIVVMDKLEIVLNNQNRVESQVNKLEIQVNTIESKILTIDTKINNNIKLINWAKKYPKLAIAASIGLIVFINKIGIMMYDKITDLDTFTKIIKFFI